jgi:D-beta-D-heptose 7-phosphate kinase/D-beta-D-heptose 1-phosphate adenosyltransferase
MNSQLLTQLLESFHSAQVLVVGDVMLDRFIYGSVERISPEAPVPVVRIERTVDMPGGASNVARNLSSLGARVILVGVAGCDAAGGDLLQQLEQIPSIESRILSDATRPTTLKIRYVVDRQQLMRADTESRQEVSDLVAKKILNECQAALPQVDGVILSDYAKGVLSEAVVSSVIAAARAAGKPVLVDPKGSNFRKYTGATLLTPNKQELRVARGQDCGSDEQVVAGARYFMEAGICESLVVTRGDEGMSVVETGGGVTHIRTVAREVRDVSGAGDTAVATLSLGLAAGGSLADAARLANVAAGIAVGKPGTAVVTTGELIATLNHFAGGDASKIFTLGNVSELVKTWRDLGLKIGFTNGCFDLLHPGHVSLLERARATADRLVVGLNSDLSVRRLKGEARPVQGEVARATVLASLKSVDAVVIFAEDTPLNLIAALEPDVLVKGADYTVDKVVGADLVMQRGGRVELLDLVAGHSTTNTVRRIAAKGS